MKHPAPLPPVDVTGCHILVISGVNSYKSCTESFLFSLVNPSGTAPTKLSLKGTSNQNGIYCHNGYGPTFGGGHDLYITSDANANSNSGSTLGHTFESPPHITPSTFFAGKPKFVVNELEVFIFQGN